MKIAFKADALQVSGPRKSDGAYSVKFETGEYEAVNVAKLLALPPQTLLSVTVEYGGK